MTPERELELETEHMARVVEAIFSDEIGGADHVRIRNCLKAMVGGVAATLKGLDSHMTNQGAADLLAGGVKLALDIADSREANSWADPETGQKVRVKVDGYPEAQA
jgi:hypothetical protein